MPSHKPGLLVLIRHGASEWNLKNIFTGWMDIPLSPQGEQEAKKAAEKLRDYSFDLAFTSTLRRATDTLDIILTGLGQNNIPIVNDKALNERHYGDLQGQNKDEMCQKFGKEQVRIWRRSYDVAPPNGESLKDTSERTLPYFRQRILPEIQAGKNVIVSAHGNSLRSIVMELEKISPEDIPDVNIPTGVPHVYELNDDLTVKNKIILSS